MDIVFSRGLWKTCKDGPREIFFARTPLGNLAWAAESESGCVTIPDGDIVEISTVCVTEAPGLDEEGARAIAARALERGYLNNPAVREHGDALLFMLVNEALHEVGTLEDIEE
jgi:hypothetical protein